MIDLNKSTDSPHLNGSPQTSLRASSCEIASDPAGKHAQVSAKQAPVSGVGFGELKEQTGLMPSTSFSLLIK